MKFPMANSEQKTKRNSQDCKQYYHLGIELEDDEDDYEPNPRLVIKDFNEEKSDDSVLNLAQELELAKQNEQRSSKVGDELKLFVNDLSEEKVENAGCDGQPVDVIVRSEPTPGAGGQGWGAQQGRKQRIIIHNAMDGNLSPQELINCGKTCCSIS